MPGLQLEVDASAARELIQRLQENMSEKQFRNAMYGVMRRTSRHVARILKQDIPKEYYAKPGRIGAAIKAPRLTNGGLGCSIPVRDKRGDIGGVYSAAGGAHGWASLHRKYRVRARIVKAGQSTLPEKKDGYPPFRNLSSSKLTFVRTSKARFPVKKVVGIAIPQMPLNRSKDEIQKDIAQYLVKQVEQRIRAMMMGI